jgi:hypothetical protein
MIREQILAVYASKEVSNFSELDTTSIMHYPMPREVTGLAEDIPYSTWNSLELSQWLTLRRFSPFRHGQSIYLH